MAKITTELAAQKVKIIDAKIEVLKQESKAAFKTAGVPFSTNNSQIGKPIAQRNSIEDLFAIGANLQQYADAHEKFASKIPVVGAGENPKARYNNVDVDLILHDVELRIKQLRRDKAIESLKATREKLLGHAPDLETELEQDALLKEIDDLLA